MDHPPSRVNKQIYDEASLWFIETRAGDLDDGSQREFDAWLRRSPEHMRAYLHVAAIWNEGPGLDPAAKWSQEKLISDAAGEPDNVVSFSRNVLPQSVPTAASTASTGFDVTSREGSTRRLPRIAAIAHKRVLAACMAGLVVLGGAVMVFRAGANVYSTSVGEQRSIVLADNSTVQLDSQSQFRVHYGEHERRIELLQGQALFQVSKDPQRPFIVTAGRTHIRAVGTQFDVYRKSSGTVVTVVEGSVAVLSEQLANAGRALLSAGEQLTLTDRLAQKADHPDVTGATAWTQRQLVFNSATLAEVAEEFNRYNRRQLVIADPDLVRFHISGVFSSSDPNSLILFLKNRGVEIVETHSEIRLQKISPEEGVTNRH